MYFLEVYIDFSIKYKILVGDNLNEDIKIIIWEIYKKLIAKDIIKKYIFKCKDCNTTRWNIKFGRKAMFYYVPACDHKGYYFTDIPCCMKFICYRDCKFTIECSKCKKIDRYIPERKPDDIGWNPVEGEKHIDITCSNCSFINNKKLLWNDEEHANVVGNIL